MFGPRILNSTMQASKRNALDDSQHLFSSEYLPCMMARNLLGCRFNDAVLAEWSFGGCGWL